MDTGSGRSVSVWMEDARPDARTPPAQALDVDVCIVGAGIAGLSTAYELARAGASVMVLEDGSIGSGETSRTTAHLSNAFDDRYFLVERLHGELGARLLADSHTAAIDEIERIVRHEEIACQFERVDGYLFVPPGESTDMLERELEACRRAGLPDVELVARAPLAGFDTDRCLRFPRQAQFHPLRYLVGLARAIEARGGQIFTGTHVESIEAGEDGKPARLTFRDGSVLTARHVVVATNTPVNDMVVLHTKQYPYRTFVIGASVPDDAVTRALYWDTAHPYHYARLVSQEDGETVLIVGGEDHKTGQQDDADARYARLEQWARERFPGMGPVEYRWSGQVLEPVDTVAFIGRNPGNENVWVVTGDSGNGLTHGALAGLLLSDLIAGRENPWAKLYEPSRKSLAAALTFAKHNLNIAAQYADWVTPGDVGTEVEIQNGCGATVRHGLQKHAVYRDATGKVHRFSATCPHLGAVVTWNSEECTWDCPAHGSRFDALGKVLNGPANSDLAPPSDDQEPSRKESTMFVKPEFNSLRDLLVDQLNDLYDAEQRLTEAMPQLADAADSTDLKHVLREHLSQTKQHVSRLEDVFHMLGVQPERTTCAAMKGLIQEGEHMVQAKAAPAVRDAGIIAAAQRVEHYELAAYGTARTFAQQLGHADVANLLQTTLDEEGAANGRLNAIAMEGVNVQAARS
jgi:glycine/D-amino acid oxidase-like deaminating enzyme/ferritin-like metal-binding protein YciE/nitrite reductase/ring-hydroxylating ferredoxin subunit